ncbi:MAG: Flp pilus assembly complex ATPase component TadA [Phycisphaeraceae bacterium]|nr:Flp pilus assembly complex ATPase component TadA [Phycisphaeraceae bacterium]
MTEPPISPPLSSDDEAKLHRLAESTGIEFCRDLVGRPASMAFTHRIPIAFARRYLLLGLASDSKDHEELAVAAGSSEGLAHLDVVSRYLRRPVAPILASPSSVLTAINLAYQQNTREVQTVIDKLDRTQVLAQISELGSRDDLLDTASRAPVIQLVNLILFEAVKQLASDIHIQPYEDRLVVRTRIDGTLFDSHMLPKGVQDEVISRLKVMGGMNIAERRLAQDGRATVQVGDRIIDLRIASLPTSHGERVVIRLLDKSARLYSLDELGMPPESLQIFQRLIHIEHGLILVTGPTGSGKSTTLYGALQELNGTALNILTLEDPIEYQLPGISQTQVSDRKGMTFSSGLRHVLRQDPDIIMVGEIRDRDTAVMAIQSALTGHLVFSTLHTNDSASAMIRLLDLGIEPYLVASSVIGILAQRLVRRICDDCARPYTPTAEELKRIGLNSKTPCDSCRIGVGCERCRRSGYRGRVGLFELLVIDEAIRELVQQRATAARILSAATARGMQTIRQTGSQKLLEGVTTISEVVRVTARATG